MPLAPYFRVWRPQASPLLELVSAHTGQYQSTVHLHDELEFGLAADHMVSLFIRGRWLTVPAGALTVTLPSEPHAVRVSPGAGVFYGLRVHSALLQKVWQERAPGLPGPFQTQPVTTDPLLIKGIVQLHHLSRSPAGLSNLELEQRLRSIVTRLLKGSWAASAPFQPARNIEAARARLEDAPETSIPLTELAEEAGLSPFHFARSFRAVTGQPPHAYLLGVRIRRAKALLLEDVPLAQLALQLGFTSQSHLTQTFRTQVGVTPMRYRQDSKILIDHR